MVILTQTTFQFRIVEKICFFISFLKQVKEENVRICTGIQQSLSYLLHSVLGGELTNSCCICCIQYLERKSTIIVVLTAFSIYRGIQQSLFNLLHSAFEGEFNNHCIVLLTAHLNHNQVAHSKSDMLWACCNLKLGLNMLFYCILHVS